MDAIRDNPNGSWLIRVPLRLRGILSWALAPLRAFRPTGDDPAAGMKAYRRRDYAQAERHFLATLKRAESLGAVSKHTATALNNLGLLYKKQRKRRKAEACFRRAVEAYEVTAPESPQLARALYHLATLCHARKEYTEAESLYQRALVLTQRTLGQHHLKFATRLEGYARLLKHTNRDGRAALMQARASGIRAQHNRIST
jgi:tetratricopeptide (TPR) repeat protein